ncbi:MAG: nuclear transport factor 2 family protein, partial [Cyanobacteria bacterium P01_E01_bin.35]
VTANHYLDEMFWQIAGSYEYGLVKEDGQWTIDKMTFVAESEKGDRDLINKAVEQAKLNPATYIQHQQTKQAVRDFLTSLEDKDMSKFASIGAEDAVQDMPFSPEGYLGARSLASCADAGSHRFPKRVEGKANLLEHYAPWSEISGKANFTDELVFYPMQDSTMVFAEWRGNVEIIPTKRTYKQKYGGLFHVVDGKIELFREYYDPIVFQDAFGLDEG